MYQLVIDQGNTWMRIAIIRRLNILEQKIANKEELMKFISQQIIKMETYHTLSIEELKNKFLHTPTRPTKAIYSTVGRRDLHLLETLKDFLGRDNVYELTKDTKVPFEVKYNRETLGSDRLAAIAGTMLFGSNINSFLVIDAGTAITYDYMTKGFVYMGGNISPGLALRFKALNSFTASLPLLEVNDEIFDHNNNLYGKNTTEAIAKGVVNGLLCELQQYIDKEKTIDKNTIVILTGGRTKYFAERLKNLTFVVPEMVLIGLNVILSSQYL